MIDYLRLLMTPTDLARIVAGSVSVTEHPFDPAPATSSDPRPESLSLRFKILDPAAGAPQLRMIFPGAISFHPDAPEGLEEMPIAGWIDFTGDTVEPTSFAAWPHRGVLRVEANNPKVVKDLGRDCKMNGIGVAPQIAWFDPVDITLDFLNDTVLNGLERKTLYDHDTYDVLEGTDAGWAELAVIQFYEGAYSPRLDIAPRDRTADDVMRFPMPHLPMDANGDVDIRITLATPRSSYDKDNHPIADPSNLPWHHPGHPSVETLPTRAFLQQFRHLLIGAAVGDATVDAIVGDDTFGATMKSRLEECGFGALGTSDNTFDRRARIAVREFQIYAKMAKVATEPTDAVGEYAQRLQPFANPMRYSGPISGFLNLTTRQHLDLWGRQRMRCPVVVTARISQSTSYVTAAPGGENLWAHDDLPNKAPRIYVRDLSDYYALPLIETKDVMIASKRFIVLGYYQSGTQGGAPGGPNMNADQSWSTMGLDALRLTGVEEATLFGPGGNAAMRSTLLSIFPTAKLETAGNFDTVNAWDGGATISIPLFHYTFHTDELAGFLAFVRDREPELFEEAIGFFGLRPRDTYKGLKRSLATRTTRPQQIRVPGGHYEDVPNNQTEENYFKTWHWFYRMVMANRIYDTWKRRAYDFARVRLQDLTAVRMTNRPPGNTAIGPVDASGNPATIGTVFTSELTMALLLRLHVKGPSRIADGGHPGHASSELWTILQDAQTPAKNGNITVVWTGDVATWTDQHELALIPAIIALARSIHADLATHLVGIRDDSAFNGHTLQRGRGTFQLHAP